MFKVLDKKLILIPFGIILLHILILSTFIFVNHFSFGVVSFLVSAILLALVCIYANKWLSLFEENLIILADDITKGKEYTINNMQIGMLLLNNEVDNIWM